MEPIIAYIFIPFFSLLLPLSLIRYVDGQIIADIMKRTNII